MDKAPSDPITDNPGAVLKSTLDEGSAFGSPNAFFDYVTEFYGLDTTPPFPSAVTFAAYSEQRGDDLYNWADALIQASVNKELEPFL